VQIETVEIIIRESEISEYRKIEEIEVDSGIRVKHRIN
jgi:hypothetical protein